MFGLGIWELVVIGIVILVLIKPEDIPKLLRGAGKITRQIKDLYRGAATAISDMSREIDRPIGGTTQNNEKEDLWKDITAGKADSDSQGDS